MLDRITFTPQQCREKATEFRELALQASDARERRELLVAAEEMAILGAELARSWLPSSKDHRGSEVN